jgi:DNA-directed RNA polymerase
MDRFCSGPKWKSLSPSEVFRKTTLNSIQEEDCFIDSQAKYWENYERDPVAGKPEQDFISRVITHISEEMEQTIVSLRQRDSKWMTVAFMMNPQHLAAVLMVSCVEALLPLQQKTVSSLGTAHLVEQQILARQIAMNIKMEMNFMISRTENPGAWVLASRYMKKLERHQIENFIRTHKSKMHLDLKKSDGVNIAIHLIGVLEKSGIIVPTYVPAFEYGKYTTPKMYAFAEDIMKGLADAHDHFLINARLRYRPMIVPPLKHTVELSGGAHTEMYRKSLVDRGYIYFKDEEFVTQFKGSKPSLEVIECLNTLMSTEWTINSRVLDVMENLYRSNGGVANLPNIERDPILDMEYLDTEDEERLKEHIKEKSIAYSAWYSNANNRLLMNMRIGCARAMEAEGFFYHVHTCDFRGREYPTTELLSPQGGDFDRGLLLFANAIPQTDEGRYWLKVHVANLFDQDKKSLLERVQWVDNNMKMLKSINADPYATLNLWADDKAKKNQSFQRLAAVFELCRTDGMTSLPISMDGSCNGIQHWSAIARDPKIGKMVNLVPDSCPNDAYAVVAHIVQHNMEGRVGSEEWATIFLDHYKGQIPRNLVKRAVMTDPYGVTDIGITKGLIKDKHLNWVESKRRHDAAVALTKYIREAMDELLRIPNAGKRWLKNVAKTAADLKIHLEWDTPMGFHVKHEYYGGKNTEYHARVHGKSIKIEMNEFVRDDVNKVEACNGIAPNFIHSLDAAHMMAVIRRLAEAGCPSFAFVHDSYGVHAPWVSILRKVTQEEFVKIHSVNQLELLKSQWEQQLGIDLPPVPSTGTLDINSVLESDYFFH